MHDRPLPVVLIRTPTGLRGQVHYGGLFATGDSVNELLATKLFPAVPQRHGFWGLTHRTERLQLLGAEQLTVAERDQLIPVVLCTIESVDGLADSLGWRYDLLRSGQLTRSEDRWQGYVHNSLAITLALLVLLGMPRLILSGCRTVAKLHHISRAERRIIDDLCPGCAYDLRGLSKDDCPECGWKRTKVGPPPTPARPTP